jgi:polyphosphate kinase 2 (PPK2 family)
MNVIATEPFPTAKTKPVRAKVEKPQPEKKTNAPREKLSGKTYEKALLKLQTELYYLQDWVRESGARMVIVLEGRDTAGKGGLIKRMTERVSPRTFRVANPSPDRCGSTRAGGGRCISCDAAVSLAA